MGTQELFNKLRNGEILYFDAYNAVLNLTDKDPERISIFINELDFYLTTVREDLNQYILIYLFLSPQFEDNLVTYYSPILRPDSLKNRNPESIGKNFHEDSNLSKELRKSLETEILSTIHHEKYQSLDDLPKVKLMIHDFDNFDKDTMNQPQLIEIEQIDFEAAFYKHEFYSFYQLKKALLKYCEPQSTPEKTPFRDQQTAVLFEYIVKNWNYDKQQKWADIWNVINDSENFKAPYQNEYQAYVIQRFKYTGRFQYDKVRKPDNRHNIELLELIKNFSKK